MEYPKTATEEQMRRVTREWSAIAREPVTVEQVKGAFFAYGSELACLRLEHKMRVGRADYSENLNTWFYTPSN